MFGIMLLLHVLGATVWTGGHLILALTVLPRVLKERDLDALLRFERSYERIGIPALLLQVASGLWLANRLVPDIGRWFSLSDPLGRVIGIKIALLTATFLLAAHVRFRILPSVTHKDLSRLAIHIVSVTAVSVLFVVAGVSFRTGWFF